MSVGVAAEIKAKLAIEEIVGESVQLRKAGTTLKGLCPFHGEKTPSFTVTPGRGTWKCFGCGLGGDVFSFVMERDAIDFPEALRRLAPRAGVELSERTSREDARKRRLHEVLESAVAFYHRVLVASGTGQRALDYLRTRGFTDATIETFQLGFAPDDWSALTRALTERRGAREEELEATGLVIRSQRRRGVYDRFRGRIMFPIRDASGNATGFGGRILDNAAQQGADAGPKYLNSPATVLFDKSRTLYLIDRAKGGIRRQARAVLVEGNTDALMAHQAGFDNVVGSLGTALTAGQVELITRYAPAIAFAYDVDSAGQSAATFGATELSALVSEIERSPHRGRLTDVGVVRLPAEKDPDEVIRETPETWRTATEHPQPIMEYLIDRFAQRHDPRTIQGRQRLVNAVMPTLRRVTDPTQRAGYLQLLARRSGVDERVLLESLRQPEPAVVRGAGDAQAGSRINLDALLSQPGAVDPQAIGQALEPVEVTLLRLVLVEPSLQAGLAARLRPEELRTTPARELWRGLLAHRDANGGVFDRSRFLEGLDPTVAELARGLYARTGPTAEPDDFAKLVEQSLLRLERDRLSDLFEFTRAELAEAEAARDDEARRRIGTRVLELQAQRADLDRSIANASLLSRSHPTQETTATREATPRIPTPAGGPA